MNRYLIILSICCLSLSAVHAQADNRQLSFKAFKENLKEDMNHKSIVEEFGLPNKDIGSGIYIYVYNLSDSTSMIIGCANRVFYAYQSDSNGNVIHSLYGSNLTTSQWITFAHIDGLSIGDYGKIKFAILEMPLNSIKRDCSIWSFTSNRIRIQHYNKETGLSDEYFDLPYILEEDEIKIVHPDQDSSVWSYTLEKTKRDKIHLIKKF